MGKNYGKYEKIQKISRNSIEITYVPNSFGKLEKFPDFQRKVKVDL